jgi:hypothetical protein
MVLNPHPDVKRDAGSRSAGERLALFPNRGETRIIATRGISCYRQRSSIGDGDARSREFTKQPIDFIR